MGAIALFRGLIIYLYGFDHNPPHVHVETGEGEFTITLKDRIVEGRARSKDIRLVNEFLDRHEKEVADMWDKAQRGEKINKINF